MEFFIKQAVCVFLIPERGKEKHITRIKCHIPSGTVHERIFSLHMF